MSENAASWQPDPTGKHDHRYWDGTQWTDNVADAGVASTDPYEAAAGADADATVADAPAPAEPEVAAADEPAAPDPTVATPAASAASGDITATWPAATAAWPSDTPPGAPPPYVPPSPVADGGGSSGGGSKRGLLVGGGILAVIALAVAAFLALGGDDDKSDVRAQLASKLRAEAAESGTDISNGQAECVADLLIDAAGDGAFKDTDFNAADPPPEVIAAMLEVGPQAFVDECGFNEEQAFGGGSTDGTDSSDSGSSDLDGLRDDCEGGDFTACDDLYFSADLGSDLEEFGSTCGGIAEPQDGFCEETNGGEGDVTGGVTDGLSDGNIADVIADSYKQAFDITDEQAECLAEKVADAIDEGTSDQTQAMTEIFNYLEDCDISMEDLGGN